MTLIEEYLAANLNLSARVEEFSEFLNENSTNLEDLVKQLELLFGLFYRGDTSIRIIQEYSSNFKAEISQLKKVLFDQQNSIHRSNEKLSNLGQILKETDEILKAIQTNAGRFVGLARSLANLAKNAEIRAYKAKQEGKGLTIIAKESLVLSRSAQRPFQDFGNLLNNLREITKPLMLELDSIIEVSSRSAKLLTRVLDSLNTIDQTVISLEKMIASLAAHNATNNELKKTIADELVILKEELIYSLNTLDDISMHCAELVSLSLLLDTQEKILNSDGEPAKRFYAAKQFNCLLNENIRVISKLSTSKKPPLFSQKIHKNIASIFNRITEINRDITELTSHSKDLAASLEEIVGLKSQLANFFTDVQGILKNLNTLGENLNVEMGKTEKVVQPTSKIFSKIKILSMMARIEESHSSRFRTIISPIVAEFTGLGSEIENAFLSIEPKISWLKKNAQILCKQKPDEESGEFGVPNFAKIKIFLDELVRIFAEKAKCGLTLLRIADELNKKNEILKRNWEGYENAIGRVLKLRSPLEQSFKQEISQPAIVKKKTVITAELSNDPLTLRPDQKTDASSHQVIANFSVGLFQFGDSAEVIPALCEDYSVSADSREYIFKIRKGIKYHNGKKLDPEDLKEGLIRALAGPNFNFFEMIAGAQEFLKTKSDNLLGVEVLDNHRLQIKLSYPFQPILANLATNIADPYLEESLPVGCGPFRISEWEKGKKVVLCANDLYFEARPTIDEFHILIIRDEEEGYELFKKGMLTIYRPCGEALKKIKKETPDLVLAVPELSIQYLCINCQKSPFTNKLVRKAICHAIDVRKLVNDFLPGNAIPAKGIFPPSMKVFNPQLDGYKYNPQKSRDLLTETGFPAGLPDTYPLDTADSPAAIKRAEFIKSSLELVGIKTEINPMAWHELLERSYNGKSVLSFQGWISDNGDPDNFLYPLFHSSSFGYPGNTFFFAHPDIDQEIEIARRIRNVSQRIKLYRKLEERILDEAPGLFMYHSLENIAIQKGVLGLKPHPLSIVRPKYVYVVGAAG